MTSIRDEYQRFLTTLAGSPVAEDVRRMANLVFSNLQWLAEVGATRRARSVRLAPIAVQQLSMTSYEIPYFTHIEAPARALGRLHELRVGPFRGFTRSETFDLSRSITLIYGANGTGKSSFCDALETVLLGSITEAQVKRIDHRSYCNNARLRRHVPPVLTSVVDEGAPTPVQPNEEAYRFCFIEKNRLDAFARIAARTPGDQRQLIATLFGVDQFADFVRGFNPSLDENLNLTGQLSQELTTRRTQLAAAEQVIQTNPARLEQFDLQETALATRINPNSSYSEICDWLLGTETQQGQLPYVQACLDAPPPVVYGVTVSGLVALLDEAYRIYECWLASTAELARRSGEVSYQQLYDAVLKLSESVPDACPACGTNLTAVAQNPYERAATGLRQLEELSELQVRANEQRETLQEAMRGLHVAMTNAVRAIGALFPDRLLGAALPVIPAVSQGDWLNVWMVYERRAWQALLVLSSEVERADSEALLLQEQRTALTVERQRLDGFRIEIERAKTLRAANEEQLGLARDTVARFDEANRELIAAVATEAPVVQLHQRVKLAYDGFLAELKSYLDELPAQLLQGLAQNARDLYNSFNCDDPPTDLANALWLPIAENGKIELEFPGQPGVRYDALVVLSEGHIKCLGLAILLAKNLAENCPIVIFDDVVNAIDDEHRNGIWRTFFESGHLDEKQVILTSHAEEFLLRIQQELGAARAQKIKCYKFLPHQGEYHLRIDSNPPSKNYVLLAQQAFESDDKRDALRYSRPAIESLTDRLWTWMGRQGDGAIELKLFGPRSTWELNNKCSKLRSALSRRPNPSAGLVSSLAALDSLLGVNGGSIEWGYLNSGTHDSQRDGEFDRATVRTIVEAVVTLDQGLAELQRPR